MNQIVVDLNVGPEHPLFEELALVDPCEPNGVALIELHRVGAVEADDVPEERDRARDLPRGVGMVFEPSHHLALLATLEQLAAREQSNRHRPVLVGDPMKHIGVMKDPNAGPDLGFMARDPVGDLLVRKLNPPVTL